MPFERNFPSVKKCASRKACEASSIVLCSEKIKHFLTLKFANRAFIEVEVHKNVKGRFQISKVLNITAP